MVDTNLAAPNGGAIHIDTGSTEYDKNMHAFHRNAREAAWYATTPKGILAVRHPEVRQILRDPGFGETAVTRLEHNGIQSGPVHKFFAEMLFSRTGEDHIRLRRSIGRAFTPRKVNRLRPVIRSIANERLDFLGATECEFVSEFAAPFAVRAMGFFLGIPEDRDVEVFGASEKLALAFTSHAGERRTEIEAGLGFLEHLADDLVIQERRAPSDNLVSDMIRLEGSESLDEEEMRMLIVVMVFGGLDTTQCQLAASLSTFADHPNEWNRLGVSPGLATSAAEEVLRFEPAGPGVARVALHDMEVNGLSIAEGTIVIPSTMSANRDDSIFPNAERFDISRAGADAQLTFGGGAHYCVGAALARAELQEVLPLLASRLPDLEKMREPEWRPFASIRGPESLHLSYTART